MTDEEKIDALRATLHQIVQWCDAYPRNVFITPDLVKARKLLNAGGVSLDAISGDAMRHCLEGVGQIARAGLKATGD